MASRIAVTKRGSRIGIATIEDRSGKLDITLFSEALENYGHLLQKDEIIVAIGSIQHDDFSGGLKMSARELLSLDEARSRYAKSLALAISQEQLTAHFVKELTEIITPYKDSTLPLHFYYQSPEGRALLVGDIEWRVTPKEIMLRGSARAGSPRGPAPYLAPRLLLFVRGPAAAAETDADAAPPRPPLAMSLTPRRHPETPLCCPPHAHTHTACF